ncbi:MAG: phosphoribosylaminoimidazolesuccinocarboxamide synthase [Bacteroidetes bacterium]|nr:phosphoribosylaminoimidazolesuccinocarboxamide synthase [Bacteroidota bacterium]
MNNSLIATNFFFKNQKDFHRGKVRDVYNIDDKYLVIVACDRISAFDHVMPKPIPYKGQILNQIAAKMLDDTAHVVPNWKIATPDPNVTIGHKCKPIMIEMVIRGYLAGHAWREYRDGKREVCGVKLPNGMKENDRFEEPIITPTIKASSGHDTDISMAEILEQKLIRKKDLEQMESYTRKLYAEGTRIADERGLILVDTKYEFGHNLEGKIILMDEVHTPDSSRYFYQNEYEANQKSGKAQKQLSKEFVRQWLIENDFSGQKDQKIPEMTEEFVDSVTARYVELYEKVTGENFVKRSYEDILGQIENNVNQYLESGAL